MLTLTKVCRRCNTEKPFDDFYVRSGTESPEHAGQYLTECKACMQERSKLSGTRNRKLSLVKSENLAIEWFKKQGIYAEPGKASYNADVDVVCFGCVWIEVKAAKLEHSGHGEIFTFTTTPRQQKRGFLAHIVMLICEWPNSEPTYHLFHSSDDVFYMQDRVKVGWTYRVGADKALKHGNNRTVMIQPMMDRAQGNYQMVWDYLKQISKDLRLEYNA